MKVCIKCLVEKEDDQFHIRRINSDGRDNKCKICATNYRRDQQKKQRAKLGKFPRKLNKYKNKSKEYQKDKFLKYQYGISLDDYNVIFANQKGCCAICSKHQIHLDKTLHVDHCHKTSKIRGLLCSMCNQALGMLEDNVDTLEKAKNYLIKNK